MAYKDPGKRRAASRKHYNLNKDKYLERNRLYREKIQDFIKELKEKIPCADCSQNYPYYVMDFDHLDATTKLEDVNSLSSSGRIGALKKEIVKCELVCANCHRIRTHTRRLSTRP